MQKDIVITGAREHNLKNISITLPREKFIVITGLSGSGKSTLAFDTLYAEGQRRYVESLSAYARQFLGLMNKPDVDAIDGLSPAISIEQKATSKNPRSTVGTVTEIYDYLRLLFARIGVPHCPVCRSEIRPQSPQQISNQIFEKHNGKNVIILAPVIQGKKGTYEKEMEKLQKDGFARMRIDTQIFTTDQRPKLKRYEKHWIEAVVDRIEIKDLNSGKTVKQTIVDLHTGKVTALTQNQFSQKEHDAMTIKELQEKKTALEAKLVRGRRGGYCFEQNTLFRAVESQMSVGPRTVIDFIRGADFQGARVHEESEGIRRGKMGES